MGDSEEGVRVLGTQGTLKDIPEEAMNKRLSQFLEERVSDGYQKKGNAEFRKFELFIHSRGLEGERNIDSDGRLEPRKRQQPSVLRASPRDVLAYLIMKDVDNSGRWCTVSSVRGWVNLISRKRKERTSLGPAPRPTARGVMVVNRCVQELFS